MIATDTLIWEAKTKSSRNAFNVSISPAFVLQKLINHIASYLLNYTQYVFLNNFKLLNPKIVPVLQIIAFLLLMTFVLYCPLISRKTAPNTSPVNFTCITLFHYFMLNLDSTFSVCLNTAFVSALKLIYLYIYYYYFLFVFIYFLQISRFFKMFHNLTLCMN